MSVDEFSAAGNPAKSPHPIAHALPPLAPDIALWWCRLDRPAAEIDRLARWLSPAEHARADRFGTDSLRQRWIVGRATLRMLLGTVVDLAPEAVPIVRGRRGRPQLADAPGIDFNVSHTRDVALIAIARGLRIGIDVERADRAVNADGLARKFLAPFEAATLVGLAPDERRRRFLRYWTCKEAMSKATGDGLAAPFRRLEIELADSAKLVAGPPPYTAEHWRLYAADPPAGFLATIAVWFAGSARPG